MAEAGGPVAAGEPAQRPPARGRLRTALLERLPLWAQLRCGMELRTLLALLLVLVTALGFAVHHFWAGRPQSVEAPETAAPPAGAGAASFAPSPSAESSGGSEASASAGVPVGASVGPSARGGETAGQQLVIDVAGKVRKPGVYRLPTGSRVTDALEKAGGLRPGTDTKGLNRARKLTDGEQIVAGGTPAPGAGANGVPASGAGTAASGGGGPEAGPVSLNSATAEQLETLPGVGPALAQRIIAFRQQHGGFRSVDQLQDVSGIGERRFADLKPQVQP